MQKPIFSVITTGKGEKDRKTLEETFNNWEITKKVFEEGNGKSKAIEFIVVDAGENAELPEMGDSTIISPKEYDEYRRELWNSRIIKYLWWDSPAIGRNLGFKYAKGRIIVFHDVDSLFSTGTEIDDAYLFSELDNYDNYFKVMYCAFKGKDIVLVGEHQLVSLEDRFLQNRAGPDRHRPVRQLKIRNHNRGRR